MGRHSGDRVRRRAKSAGIESYVVEHVLEGGQSYRTAAGQLGCSPSAIARAVSRVRAQRENEAAERFAGQASLCRRRMISLERRAQRGDIGAEQELRRWAAHEAVLFGLRAPAKLEIDSLLRTRPTLRMAACLEALPCAVLGALAGLPDGEFVREVEAITGIRLQSDHALQRAETEEVEFTEGGDDGGG